MPIIFCRFPFDTEKRKKVRFQAAENLSKAIVQGGRACVFPGRDYLCAMSQPTFFKQSVWVRVLPFAVIYGVYAAGLPLDVMDVDAAQYAELSREMYKTGNYLHIYERGRDYLDKPPLVFWITAVFYRIFGVSEIVFRLPSLLFSLLGNYATYRLTRRYYGPETGYLAALMVASCQAFFLFNHDVRMDTMLTGSVIFAIWQIDAFLLAGRLVHVLLGFTGIAAAMLAKGPVGLMVPVLAFSVDFAVKRQWRNFFRWQWLAGMAWVGLLLLPMCIGLYEQFDLHPEKTMYGHTGTSGLRFYFWTQSFGRITGESTWRDDSDVFFFMHTFLWAFLPWCLLFLAGLFWKAKALAANRFRLPASAEALALGGFVLPYIAFSASRYQLPHYLFVLFPLAAMLTAAYLHPLLVQAGRAAGAWRWIQLFVGGVVWSAGCLLLTAVFAPAPAWLWVAVAVFAAAAVACGFQRNPLYSVVGFSVFSIAGVNLILNAYFYPSLFCYQSGSVLGAYVRAHAMPSQVLYAYRHHPHSLDFAARQVASEVPAGGLLPGKGILVYTDTVGIRELEQAGNRFSIVKTTDDYAVSMLSLPFLNPDTRSRHVNKMYLLRTR